MTRERPRVVVVKRSDHHGCLLTLILLVLAWPLAIAYWLVRILAWIIGTAIDWITLGPVRRRR
jgi:hypothetical protein